MILRGMKTLVETSAQQEIDIDSMLDTLCARNKPCEFHYTNMSGEVFVGRSRFLGQNDQQLHLDTPQIIGKQTALLTGKTIEIFITVGTETYTFRSKIIQAHCKITLNHYITVNGVYISKPTKMWQAQKRHDLRLRFKEDDQIPAVVNLTAPDHPNAAPLEGPWVQGVLEDLSASGCGLHLNTPRCSDFKYGHPIFLSFTLPNDDTELIVQAEVRTIRPPSNGFQTRIGVKFLNWPSRAYLTHTLRPVERFLAKVQRDRLKEKQSKR